MTTDWLPSRRHDQLAMAHNWGDILVANAQNWGIPTGMMQTLAGLETTAREALESVGKVNISDFFTRRDAKTRRTQR